MAPIYKVPLSNNSQYTLDTQYTAGGTSLVLNTNVASVVQAPGTCVVDRVDSSGNKTASKRTYYTFTGVSTTTLTGLAVADGTDQSHAVGAVVEFVPDITWAQAMYNGLTAVVDPTTQALDTTKVVDLTTAQTISKKTIKSSLSEVVTTAGGTTTYTLTPSVAIAAYATGQEFFIKMNATNTGASTINVSGLGAKSLTKGGATALASGDLLIDAVYKIVYDGTQFQVSGVGSGGTAFWSDVPGTPTRVSDTQFTITDTSNANLYDLLLKKGTILKWLESTTFQTAMVISSSYGANTVTINIVGDSLTAGFTSMKYAIPKAQTETFIIAGTFPSAATTDLSKTWYPSSGVYILSADLVVKTAGSGTGSTVVDINVSGSTKFTTKPTLTTTGTSDIDNVADNPSSEVAAEAPVTIDVDSVTATSAPVDGYIRLYYYPSDWRYRS